MLSAFTLAAYERLCQAIVCSGVTPLRVMDALSQRPDAGFIILRYDVDARPGHALRMARLLHRYALRGTFYWHAAPPALFPVEMMRQVASLGHEVGYHYAALSRCDGDLEAAARLFRGEVARFRRAGFDIRTAAAHGVPGYDNRSLVQQRPDLLVSCGLTGEAYLSIDFGYVQYVSDAGWAWRRFPLRSDAQEYRAAHGPSALPRLTDADVRALLDMPGTRLYLTTHPELWFESGVTATVLRARRAIGTRLLAWRPAARVRRRLGPQ